MKRFVYIPPSISTEDIPPEALQLASQSALPIRIGEEGDNFKCDGIQIISVPEISRCDVPDVGMNGYVFPIDITYEFTVFDSSTELILSNGIDMFSTKPTLREKHRARFRPRLQWSGDTYYAVSVNNTVIASGVFKAL